MHHGWVRRAAIATTAALVGLTTSAWASLPVHRAPLGLSPEPAELTTSAELGIKMRNQEGSRIIGQMVSDEGFWADSWTKTYDGKVYDQIRLKDTTSGYLPMISGEGQQDFNHDVVAHIIFHKMSQLPLYMSGAKAVTQLGKGYDDEIGAEYSDTFWFLDLSVLYVVYPMRMYKRHDPAANTTYLWFEKLEPSFVDDATWDRYSRAIEETKGKVDLRWPPFNSVNEVDTLYGIFVVSPGKTRESRVTFVSKLTFGDGAGWMAKFGSQLPSVLKSGLRNGFVASVAIADAETKRRAAANPG